jgi:hypothetical protein
MKNATLPLCLSLTILLFSGCSDQKTLSRSKALNLLQKTGFTDGFFITFKTGHFCWRGGTNFLRRIATDQRMYSNDPQRPYIVTVTLEPAGLSSLVAQPTEFRDAFGNLTTRTPLPTEGGYACYVIAFTPEAMPHVKNGDWKEIERQPNGDVTYKAQVATTEITGVTGITSNADQQSATVEFAWKVAPTSQRDIFFKGGMAPVANQSKATFQLYDDGWRVMTIDGTEVPKH